MYRVVLLMLLSSLSCFVTNAQDSPVVIQIKMCMLSLKNALLTKDSVVLANLLADDVSYGLSNGLILKKSELIKSVMSGEQEYRSIETMTEMNVRMYDSTSVVIARLKASFVFRQQATEQNIGITSTWVRSNSEWKLVALQGVKLED